MARVLIILVVLAVIVWVVSIVDCAVQPATRHRGVSKGAWIAIVILLPVIGGVLWFWLGRTRANDPRQNAPDDDTAFLDSLRQSSAASAAQDERIRQLEEELARLDAEDSDTTPRGGAHDELPSDRPSGSDDDDSRDQHGARG